MFFNLTLTCWTGVSYPSFSKESWYGRYWDFSDGRFLCLLGIGVCRLDLRLCQGVSPFLLRVDTRGCNRPVFLIHPSKTCKNSVKFSYVNNRNIYVSIGLLTFFYQVLGNGLLIGNYSFFIIIKVYVKSRRWFTVRDRLRLLSRHLFPLDLGTGSPCKIDVFYYIFFFSH